MNVKLLPQVYFLCSRQRELLLHTINRWNISNFRVFCCSRETVTLTLSMVHERHHNNLALNYVTSKEHVKWNVSPSKISFNANHATLKICFYFLCLLVFLCIIFDHKKSKRLRAIAEMYATFAIVYSMTCHY